MGGEWRQVKLSEVCEIRRGSSPRPIVDYISETKGFPWVKIADATSSNSRFIEKTNQFIKEEGVSRSVIVSKGDLILSNSGTAGLPKFMNITACIHDGWQVLRNLNDITKEFLYYTLLYIRPALLHNAYDSTMKNLTLDMVRDAQIKLPPLREQKQITCTLGSIDRKIELNRQTNETLEKMAQALFKSWFVDFDPVIDNALAAGNAIPDELQDRAERRQQQLAKPDHQPLPDAIRQLFPSGFELTEAVGWVPMGWSVSSVGNVIENVGGGTPKTKEDAYWVGGIHAFCTPKDMSNMTSKILLNTERHLTKAGVLKISSGILPVGTVLMSSRAPIGYLAITDIPVSINQGIIALKQNEKYSSEYLLCWAESNLKEVVSRANGSTFLEISKKNFRDIPFLEPEGNVLPAFANLAHSYFERIASLQRQVDQLTKLRDTLLPKLISGELRLPPDASADAEQQLADATS